jgi:DNA-binding GntR family transcriptional regulator
VPPRRDDNGVPTYRQIALALQERIDKGEWGPSGQLPTEAQLTVEFGVNRLTARQAIADLERAGSVIVRQGKGVFVTPPFVRSEIMVDPATQKVDMGTVNVLVDELHGVLYERVVAALAEGTPEAARHLGLPVADVQRVDTLIGMPGDAAGMLTSYWLDRHRFAGLAARWTGDVTLPVLLRAEYGIELRYDWRGFSAIAAGLADAQHLGVAVGHPLLIRDGVSVDDAGVPVYYVRRRFRGERVKFVLRFRDRAAPRPGSLSSRSPERSVPLLRSHLDKSDYGP